MTSSALVNWRSNRLGRFDRLLAAHPESASSVTDPRVGQEWTEALVLRLAAEFQGFCRDLHDDAIEMIMEAVSVPSSKLAAVLMNGLILGRGLDRRSADPRTIGADFERLGSDVWVSLATVRPDAAATWRQGLTLLHRARNGVAHDDDTAIAAAGAAGWPVELETVCRWRLLLDDIATAMHDSTTGDLAELLGRI